MFATPPPEEVARENGPNKTKVSVEEIKQKELKEMKNVEDHADAEGYFQAPPGTTLKDGNYVIHGELGRGVFSTVFFVKDKTNQEEYAAKISRSNETMYNAGLKELSILKEIGQHPHVVWLIDSFELENQLSKAAHLVLVFERMGSNLRETLNKYGQNVGISLEAIRTFGRQLFSSLARLRELGIVHADFKPDNILISADLRRCALGDLGSAFHLSDSEAKFPTPYLVSRFYRSPEIILGLQYGCEADVWSLGVTLFELFCGQVLFPGHTNNEMLHLFQKCLGKFPNSIVKRHIAAYEQKLELEPHFESKELKFKSHEADPVNGNIVRRLVKFTDHPNPAQSLKGLVLKKALQDSDEAELDETILDFIQVLEQCLTLDPAHRIDPRTVDNKLTFFGGKKEKRNVEKRPRLS